MTGVLDPVQEQKLSRKATANALRNGWGIKTDHGAGLRKNEIQRRSDGDPEAIKSAKPASFTINAKRTLKNLRGLARKKPHATVMDEGEDKKRCVPIPRQTGARSMVVGTWRMNYSMAMGI